jgi:hypothetical protein
MIPERKLINYAVSYLSSEIVQIEKLLDNDEVAESERKILCSVLNEYRDDLSELYAYLP